jgi:hypothetical protein
MNTKYLLCEAALQEANKVFRTFKWKNLKISIDQKKGTYKHFTDDPSYPLKGATYPTDYGFIHGYTGEDKHGLDVFVGTGRKFGYFFVERLEVPQEIKTIINCTDIELKAIFKEFDPLIISKKIISESDFFRLIKKYKD